MSVNMLFKVKEKALLLWSDDWDSVIIFTSIASSFKLFIHLLR